MDFQGQKLSEYLYYYIIILFGTAGWLYGWREGSFLPVFYAWAAGLVLSLIVCCPDWPFYNRHPVQWLKEFPRSTDSAGNSTTAPAHAGGAAAGGKNKKA